MLRSAIDVLAVFDLDRPDPPPVALEAEPPIEPLGYSVAEEIERRVAEAVAAVRAEERADAEWQLTEALAEQARSLRAEQEVARNAWVEEQSDRIAAAIDARFAELGEQLGVAAARALRPFLVERVVDRSVDDLADCLRGLMTDGSAPPLEITGPADLLDRLAEKLGGHAAAITFRPGDHADIVVTAGETLIETRLREWVARLLHSEE
ncbi:hypothetical protein CXZ10_04810 [Pleomorphomonas diazotrophica]|uniref:Flagellar assembly protein FliH/Type III secretion system HrpE domain-containing protein n=1 Tax=Pleomorphomonas diazotrophica TaxID=1166257 RepID=A0A1I4QHC0_9HYPH|nr:hypothetical protein [Pleomorphomonas diazotrophica]PKR90684.1 hypothetical protein CXZ10_04810 [Pleomorphomonas diazotrophica]SFM39050.1 hypothetical protein SAMN05192571_101351 [Pleomorphomonas diazotrophica]